MKKRLNLTGLLVTGVILASFSLMAIVPSAFAHVVVTPKTAATGQRVSFNVSVPNERNVDVTSLRLDIPTSLSGVQPTVQAGFKIHVDTANNTGDDKNGHSSNSNVISITWTGLIPVGQRADFGLKAIAPAGSGEIQWKAYQTYADGVVVSWDQSPSSDTGDSDDTTTGPYSVTNIVDDLDQSNGAADQQNTTNLATLALVVAIAALLSSVLLLLRRRS